MTQAKKQIKVIQFSDVRDKQYWITDNKDKIKVLKEVVEICHRHSLAIESEKKVSYWKVYDVIHITFVYYEVLPKVEVLPVTLKNTHYIENIAEQIKTLPAIAKKFKINFSTNTASKHRLIVHKDGLFIEEVTKKNDYFPDFGENNSKYYHFWDDNFLKYSQGKKVKQGDTVIIQGLTQIIQLMKVLDKQKVKYSFELQEDQHFTYLAITNNDNLNYRFKLINGKGYNDFNLGEYSKVCNRSLFADQNVA